MEIKLLRLIYDYSINGKLVDINFIEKLIDIVVTSKQLDKYVYNLAILPEKESQIEDGISIASYNPFSKVISVYVDGVNQMLEHNDRYLVLFENIEQIFYKNLSITQVILHELEHANQRKIIEKESSLESEILKLSSAEINIKTGIKLIKSGYSVEQVMIYIMTKKMQSINNYRKNYDIAPEERLAEIKSYQEIIDLLSHIKKYVPNLLEFEQTNKLENLLRGFKYDSGFLISPTITYLLESENAHSLNKFEWFNQDYYKCLHQSKEMYSLEDRLKYGLMIDDKEFEYCDYTLKTSRKYNC